jgi:catechol-2,3-dioxygenase
MGLSVSLNRHPSHERLERMALLGHLHSSTGHPDKARECYEKVLKWDPEFSEAKLGFEELVRSSQSSGKSGSGQEKVL